MIQSTLPFVYCSSLHSILIPVSVFLDKLGLSPQHYPYIKIGSERDYRPLRTAQKDAEPKLCVFCYFYLTFMLLRSLFVSFVSVLFTTADTV